MLEQLKSLDFHPKLVSDFAVRTRTGAFISIAAIVVALILFVSELRLYLTLESVEHMEVDDAAAGGFRGGAAVLNKMLRINFDVTFPGIACALLSLDAADASGQHNENVIHNVFKRRLATDGTPIGVGEKEDSLRVLKTTEELQREKNKAISEGRPSAPKVDGLCGDCYGAAAEGVCCNTCEDVREVYKKKGWQFSMKGVSQCEKEGFYGDVAGQMSQNEGCNVYGSLEVPKVPGGFHFGPGHEMQQAYQNVGDMVGFLFTAFNVSHKVNVLSFGPFVPGGGKALAPLDGRAVNLAEGTGMHQYFIKLVPLVYMPLQGEPVLSYQFSVTEHVRMLHKDLAAVESATGLLPGVFFNYELSPLRVRIEERRRSFGHFLTNCCAIIGGVFTVMGLLDSVLHKTFTSSRKGVKHGML